MHRLVDRAFARLLALTVLFTGCVEPFDSGDDGSGSGSGSGSNEPQTIEVVLGDLQPGWLVTTSRLLGSDAPSELRVVSDGTPVTLTGTTEDVFIATITDSAGTLVATRAMSAPCMMAGSRQLRVPSDFATIQQAIDAAVPGDTVKVAPGTYTESVTMHAGICLLGSGAKLTTLDAGGEARTLIDLTSAPGSVVAGFRLRGVGQAETCGTDTFGCSGDWYASAIHLRGLDWNDPIQDAPPLIINNVFEGNDIALLMWWRSVAVIRNNVFAQNRVGFMANHFQSRTLVANNVFYNNTDLAIGNQAAYLDIINNVIVGSRVGVLFQYVQTGWIRCNIFYANAEVTDDVYPAVEDRITIGSDGNVIAEPRFIDAGQGDYHLHPDSPGKDKGCFAGSSFDADGTQQDIGVYGGPLSAWVDL